MVVPLLEREATLARGANKEHPTTGRAVRGGVAGAARAASRPIPARADADDRTKCGENPAARLRRATVPRTQPSAGHR